MARVDCEASQHPPTIVYVSTSTLIFCVKTKRSLSTHPIQNILHTNVRPFVKNQNSVSFRRD
jgi:hypothetical protein